MSYKELILSMKKLSFNEALEVSVEIFDANKKNIGRLVPIGPWIINEKDKIELIHSWRSRAMRMFLTQFDSTYEKTLSYLKNLSIGQEGRILFLMYDSNDQFIGHIGIANVDGRIGELDNLIRGVRTNHPRLVYFAEIALLNWCFKNLEITESDVRVLSYNFLVISLHEEVGYVRSESIPLLKNIKNGDTSHEMCLAHESNVNYSCIRMLLKKDDFYQVNNWIY